MTANAERRICVVGSAMVDLVARVPKLPEPGETLVGSTFQIGFGGKGSNQAVMAARLGANVAMVARLGQDVFGENTLTNYKKQGIDTRFVLMDESRFSGVAPISVDEGSGQNAIVIIPGANMGLSPAGVRDARELIQSTQIVICQLEIPIESTMEAFKIAREAGVITILNPAPAAELPDELLALSDICIPNETEARILTGHTVNTPESATFAGKALLKRGPHSVIITLGEKGAVCFEGDTIDYIPAEKVEAVDTTGAGDAFVGTLAFQLAGGHPMTSAVRSAVAVASRSVLKEGTQTSFPCYDDVAELLKGSE
jgi:ribokinase